MKPGDYVRTNKGIAKYLGLGRDVLKYEINKNTYEHYYSQHVFDNYIFGVGHDYGDTLTNDEFNNIDKLGKVKESILDLISIGDYVNGKEVFTLIDNQEPKLVVTEDGCLNNKEIKSIVTKEQFEIMEYRTGE